jgi:hypothetical protein
MRRLLKLLHWAYSIVPPTVGGGVASWTYERLGVPWALLLGVLMGTCTQIVLLVTRQQVERQLALQIAEEKKNQP